MALHSAMYYLNSLFTHTILYTMYFILRMATLLDFIIKF